MFIRQTKTSNAASGEAYYTFRLVASERIDGKVRQQTLLNLGKNFSLPREQWPQLCARIEAILAGQLPLLPVSPAVETLAQRYAARLVTGRQTAAPSDETGGVEYPEVDVASLHWSVPDRWGLSMRAFRPSNGLNCRAFLRKRGSTASSRRRPSAA